MIKCVISFKKFIMTWLPPLNMFIIYDVGAQKARKTIQTTVFCHQQKLAPEKRVCWYIFMMLLLHSHQLTEHHRQECDYPTSEFQSASTWWSTLLPDKIIGMHSLKNVLCFSCFRLSQYVQFLVSSTETVFLSIYILMSQNKNSQILLRLKPRMSAILENHNLIEPQ